MISGNLDKHGYPNVNYGDEFPSPWPDEALFYRIDEGQWYKYQASSGSWVKAAAVITVTDGAVSLSADKIIFDGTFNAVTDAGSGDAQVDFDETAIDHGNIGGLGDDDHPHYLKEEASGGTAAEVPDHDHTSAAQCGTLRHENLDNITTDDHHAKSHAHDGVDGSGTVAHSATTGQGVDDHHAKSHAHDGVDGSGTVAHSDTTGLTTDDHHAKSHVHDGVDGSGTVDFSAYSLNSLGTKDHDLLTGLTDDDHTQYCLLAGRSGGQTFNGGTDSGDDLYIYSTSHATKGDVYIGYDSTGTQNLLTVESSFESGDGKVRIRSSASEQLEVESYDGNNTLVALSRKGSIISDNTETGRLEFRAVSASSLEKKFAAVVGWCEDNAGTNQQDGNLDLLAVKNNADVTVLTANNNGKVGVGTQSPSYDIHIYRDGANASLVTERNSGVVNYINSTADYGNFGTVSSHPLRLVSGSAWAVRIENDYEQMQRLPGPSSAGEVKWGYSGLDGTARTIIADGTPDVVTTCDVRWLAKENTTGTTARGHARINNGGTSNQTVGGATIQFAVAANGALTVQRTAGANSVEIVLSVLFF